MGQHQPPRRSRMQCSTAVRNRWVTVSLGILLAASVVGLTLMSSWVNSGAPDGFVRPFASSIWLATLSAYFAVDALVHIWHGRSAWLCCGAAVEPWIYIVLLGVVLCSMLGYALAQRWGAFAWTWVFSLVLAVSLYWVKGTNADRHTQYKALANDDGPYTSGDIRGDSINANDSDDVLLGKRGQSGRTRKCCECSMKRVATWIRGTVRVFAIFFTVALLGGAVLEAQGYSRYLPQGKFVTITHASGLSQTVLAQCVTPPGYVPNSHPTFWSEVGGLGHSMSDLWGLRDELVNTYGVRYCSYDMPGSGWSEESAKQEYFLGEQVSLTEKVMEEMGEEGPFVMMGSMDSAYDRALNFALFHEEKVVAVVPVALLLNEFQVWRDFHGKGDDAMITYASTVLQGRALIGNLITFFAVNWGLIGAYRPPSPTYVPHDKAAESLFLNVLNEKQWTTNVAHIMQQLDEPDLGLNEPPSFGATAMQLNTSIPILIFGLGRNASQLASDCRAQSLAIDSAGCRLNSFTYNKTLAYNQLIQSYSNASKLFMCAEECAETSKAFLVNQDQNIKWFTQTLMAELKIPPRESKKSDQADSGLAGSTSI